MKSTSLLISFVTTTSSDHRLLFIFYISWISIMFPPYSDDSVHHPLLYTDPFWSHFFENSNTPTWNLESSQKQMLLSGKAAVASLHSVESVEALESYPHVSTI